MLIILGDVLSVPVGDLFRAALKPGLVLITGYILYIVVYCLLNPEAAPVIENKDSNQNQRDIILKALIAVIPPLALILVVLGSIFNAVATPTESSALGCVGAIILAILYRKFSPHMLWESAQETVKITSMVFAVLLGASIFSMGFSYTGGEEHVEHLLMSIPGEKWGFLITIMIVITLLGFFLDYIEISYIVLPLVYVVVQELGINQVWFAILVAMNLQTSFLTPPFGFALFYLKGVAPDSVTTAHIYRGVVPFIAIQLIVLMSMLFFPHWYGMSSIQTALW